MVLMGQDYQVEQIMAAAMVVLEAIKTRMVMDWELFMDR